MADAVSMLKPTLHNPAISTPWLKCSPPPAREAEMDDLAVAAARQTCRAWRRMVGACLHGTLIPASFQTARHLAAFPTITVVDLRDVSRVWTQGLAAG